MIRNVNGNISGGFAKMYDFLRQIFSNLDFSVCRISFPEDKSKYIQKREQGIVLYTKPKSEHRTSYKKPEINRRLNTFRVQTHTKK